MFGRAAKEALQQEREQQQHDAMEDDGPSIPFLLSMLTMLDFSERGRVTKDDWERGCASLFVENLDVESSWNTICQRFDKTGMGNVDFGGGQGLAPLDPRVQGLMRVVVQTLVRLSERCTSNMANIHDTKMKMMRNTVNMWKERAISTTFRSWKDWYELCRRRRREALASIKYGPCRKCLHAMHNMITVRKQQMLQAANMMRGGEVRLMQTVLDAWRDSHGSERDGRLQKLQMFFLSREEWWRHHVVDTWRRTTKNERKLRLFLGRWRNQILGRILIYWNVRHQAAR